MDQRQSAGGCAYLKVKDKYIYYLVTKRHSNGKPTYQSLFSSLCKMKDLINEHKVEKLAMPTIGCGLDDLSWDEVKAMITYIFGNADVEITICHFKAVGFYCLGKIC